MLELRVYVSADSFFRFVEPLTAPADAPDARPWLLTVSDLVLRARAGSFRGTFSNENASITVTLDNKGRQASSLLRQPTRQRAEVYEDDALYFAGTVQGLLYGTVVELGIEA